MQNYMAISLCYFLCIFCMHVSIYALIISEYLLKIILGLCSSEKKSTTLLHKMAWKPCLHGTCSLGHSDTSPWARNKGRMMKLDHRQPDTSLINCNYYLIVPKCLHGQYLKQKNRQYW